MIRNLAAFLADVFLGIRPPEVCPCCGWISRGPRSMDKHAGVCG